MRDLDKVLEMLDIDSAMKNANWIVDNVGWRISGTKYEKQVLAFFEEYYEKEGITFDKLEYDALIFYPGESKFTVLDDEGEDSWDIPCNAFAQRANTPEGGFVNELIYVGNGAISDYEGLDVEGKIILCDLTYDPPRPEKMRIAEMFGADGLVMINWGLEEHNTVPSGSVKNVWGNPTSESEMKRLPNIPAVGIKRKDGNRLVERLTSGEKLMVRLDAHGLGEWRKCYIPIAKVEATGPEADMFAIMGGHYDAWGPGATCNAAGNAGLLEVVKVLHANRDKLKRSIWFPFWSGHETGGMAGSSYFVDYFWDELTENGISYMNMDQLGLADIDQYDTWASGELVDYHIESDKYLMEKDMLDEVCQTMKPEKVGDQSFYGIGIPTLHNMGQDSAEKKALYLGATLGWWYHSHLDTMEMVSRETLLTNLQVMTAYVYGLVTKDILPFDHTNNCEIIEKRLRELKEECKGVIDLDTALDWNQKLKDKLVALNELAANSQLSQEQRTTLNRGLLKLSRILSPMLATVAGKYAQDNYGLTALKTFIPALWEMKDLGTMDRDSDEYKMLFTKMKRERNKATDAIKAAFESASVTEMLIKG